MFGISVIDTMFPYIVHRFHNRLVYITRSLKMFGRQYSNGVLMINLWQCEVTGFMLIKVPIFNVTFGSCRSTCTTQISCFNLYIHHRCKHKHTEVSGNRKHKNAKVSENGKHMNNVVSDNIKCMNTELSDNSKNNNTEVTENSKEHSSNVNESSHAKNLNNRSEGFDEKDIIKDFSKTENATVLAKKSNEICILNEVAETTNKRLAEDDGEDAEEDIRLNLDVSPNIRQFLDEMDMAIATGYTCLLTVCPKLGRDAMKKKNRSVENMLYINSTSGYFYCAACNTRGQWSQLRDNIQYWKSRKVNRKLDCFKDVVDVDRSHSIPPVEVHNQFNNSQDFSTLTEEQFNTILTIFDWHGLRRKTFEKYGAMYRQKDNIFYVLFPLLSKSGVTTAVNVHSGFLTNSGKPHVSPVLTYPRSRTNVELFGWQNQPKSHPAGTFEPSLVITSSEVHAMAVWQEMGIFSLALRNVSQLPESTLPYLEDFKQIHLWIGTDVKAWENSKIFAKKLNDQRCYIFRPNVLKFMPLDVLQCDRDMKKILSEACLIGHKSILTFENLRPEVLAEFAHYKQVAGVQWKRYSKLNDLLKGFRRGELTILTGPTGSGKTTFLSEYSLDLAEQGVNTLWGSFEISNVRLVKIMMQQYVGYVYLE